MGIDMLLDSDEDEVYEKQMKGELEDGMIEKDLDNFFWTIKSQYLKNKIIAVNQFVKIMVSAVAAQCNIMTLECN